MHTNKHNYYSCYGCPTPPSLPSLPRTRLPRLQAMVLICRSSPKACCSRVQGRPSHAAQECQPSLFKSAWHGPSILSQAMLLRSAGPPPSSCPCPCSPGEGRSRPSGHPATPNHPATWVRDPVPGHAAQEGLQALAPNPVPRHAALALRHQLMLQLVLKLLLQLLPH